jgi:glycosyltransferase domain-containing protein
MMDNVSIIIPTYDRPDALRRTISYLQAGRPRLPIIVADGSNGATAARNAETCARLGANITYLSRPSATKGPGAVSTAEYAMVMENYFERYSAALEAVTTDYVAVCADDDLLVPESAVRAAAFLDEHPAYVSCHGIYLAFRYIDTDIQIESVIYDGRSIDGTEVGSRLMQLLAHYEAPYYGVYRTAIQREIMAQVSRINVGLFFEIFHSSATAVRGKIKRLGNIYYLRNVGNPPHARPREGLPQWASTDLDDLHDRYREHRQRVIDFVSA